MSDVFLDNNGIVRSSLICKETCLTGANDSGENRLDSIDNNSGYQLVVGVA